MGLFRTITVDGGLIGIWQFSENSEELLKQIQLTDSEKEELSKYSFYKRKVEWLAIRILIGQLIGSDYSLTYAETGKPILTDPKYHFLSISHARDFAAVLVHESCEVGIDLENIDRNYKSIEKRYLSVEELACVQGKPLLQCLYWCAKEAIFKVVPHDGVEFKEEIRIHPFKVESNGQFAASYLHLDDQHDFQLNYEVFDHYGLVWVIDRL